MGINQSYAVFGLGRYGMAVARELVESGAEVLAVDCSEELVNSASAWICFSASPSIPSQKIFKSAILVLH